MEPRRISLCFPSCPNIRRLKQQQQQQLLIQMLTPSLYNNKYFVLLMSKGQAVMFVCLFRLVLLFVCIRFFVFFVGWYLLYFRFSSSSSSFSSRNLTSM